MKVRLYTDYDVVLGTIETNSQGKLIVTPAKGVPAETLEGRCEFYASQLYGENFDKTGVDDESSMPTGEEVLRRMASRMTDGKRAWCEILEGRL